ncbi:MAG TPA: dihydrofolate reductase family protein [Steroidobacteraceae bacterium]
MRELILKMSISIDGFVASPDGGNQWVVDTRDPKAGEWMVNTLWDAGLHVIGSRSFHDWARYWPASTTMFAPPMNQIPKAVFSRQGTSILAGIDTTAAAESWAKAYVAAGDLKEEIAKLKAQDGKPIIAHGGVTFARSLVAAGVIDQYVLMVHPVVLGKGLPLFADLSAPKVLRLVSSTTFPRGSVAQVYRPT